MLSPAGAIGVKIFLFVVALLAVVLKQCVRWWLQTRFGWTDGFIVLALALYLAEEVIAVLLWKDNFFDMPVANFSVNNYPQLLENTTDKVKLSYLLRMLFFSSFVTFTIFWVVKGAFMGLYYHLIPSWLKALRWTVHITSGIVFASYLGFLGTNIFSCGDVGRNWSIDPEQFCFSFNGLTAVIYLTTIHLLTEVIIFVIPFFLLPHLMLPTAEKWGLAFMFALGLMTISCTVARTAIVLSAPSFTYHELLAWDSGEITLGMTVVCAPSIKWFILWISGHKRKRAIRAFNGQADSSTALSNVGTRTGKSGNTASKNPRKDEAEEEDTDDDEKSQDTNPISVVVKHEVSVDIESLRAASRDEQRRTHSANSSSKELSESWSDGNSPKSFLHL